VITKARVLALVEQCEGDLDFLLYLLLLNREFEENSDHSDQAASQEPEEPAL
jgi:hypothetical protein